MKYYSFNEFDGEKGWVSTLSEKEVIDSYYDYWYNAMCKKYGKEVVDRDYCKQDCIDDWAIVHWAWESNERNDP